MVDFFMNKIFKSGCHLILAFVLTFLVFDDRVVMAGAIDYGPSHQQIVLQINNPDIYVNGFRQPLEHIGRPKPVMRDGRTLLPIASVVKQLGGEVGWDSNERKITIRLDVHYVEMWLGKKNAVVNGEPMTLDVAPQIIQNKTMVPLRFVSDSLGLQLRWYAESQVIILYYHESGETTPFWFEKPFTERLNDTTGIYRDGGSSYKVQYPLAWGEPYVIYDPSNMLTDEQAYGYRTVFYNRDGTLIEGYVVELEPGETPAEYMKRTGRVEGGGYQWDKYDYSHYGELANGNGWIHSATGMGASPDANGKYPFFYEFLLFSEDNVTILSYTGGVSGPDNVLDAPQMMPYIETLFGTFESDWLRWEK